MNKAQRAEVIEQYRKDAAADERMIQTLCAQIDRITAERDGLRKALDELDKAIGRMWRTNPHERSGRNQAIAAVEVAQRAANTALCAPTPSVPDAERS